MKQILVLALLVACKGATDPQLASCHEQENTAYQEALHAPAPASMLPEPEPTKVVWRLDPITIITFTRTVSGCDVVRLQ